MEVAKWTFSIGVTLPPGTPPAEIAAMALKRSELVSTEMGGLSISQSVGIEAGPTPDERRKAVAVFSDLIGQGSSQRER